jgi:hypothetical protein
MPGKDNEKQAVVFGHLSLGRLFGIIKKVVGCYRQDPIKYLRLLPVASETPQGIKK